MVADVTISKNESNDYSMKFFHIFSYNTFFSNQYTIIKHEIECLGLDIYQHQVVKLKKKNNQTLIKRNENVEAEH